MEQEKQGTAPSALENMNVNATDDQRSHTRIVTEIESLRKVGREIGGDVVSKDKSAPDRAE